MKIFLTVISLLSLMILGACLYAPHLPALFLEGYPSSTWPASGHFAEVKGVKTGAAQPVQSTIQGKKLKTLLKDSQAYAMAIYAPGKQAIEYYADGYDENSRFNSFSAVKSLVGLLVYRAVSEQKISSLSDPIGKYLSEISDKELSDQSIQSFLDMRSGVIFETGTMKTMSGIDEKDMEQALANPFGPMARLHVGGPDEIWTKLISKPGMAGQYSYQNVNTALLGRLLEKVYGVPLADVLSEKVWMPSGASTAYWRKYAEGRSVSAYCCLFARIRDWGAVARYIMTNGTANNPLLPQDLWQKFMGQYFKDQELVSGQYANHARYNILDRKGEALQGPFTYFMGQGGQTVYMMPQHGLVVVRFGKKHQLLHSTLYEAWKE